jgi:hypothetical protein
MAKLAKLLDAKEPLFSQAIKDLEEVTGRKSRDVQLLADITRKAHERMGKLGLDPKDTTARELYKALENRMADDNKRIARDLLKVDEDADIRTLVPPMVKIASRAHMPHGCWALKRSVAKRLLKKMPPKAMMTHLGYRTVDSMLKREPFDEMYTALRFSETPEWLNEYNELFKTVTPSDFEHRDITITIMDHDKWVDLTAEFVHKKKHNVTHTKELGSIVIVPMQQTHMKGLPLKTLPLLFHYLNEVRLYSAFFKLKSTAKNFGEIIVETLIADPGNTAVIAGQDIHWRVIQRYFGKLPREDHPEAFEPHVHPEDLHWRKAEDVMYDLDPSMTFWQDMDYVILDSGRDLVSFNMVDVSFSYSNEDPFETRNIYHARESLWNQIFMSYIGEKVLEQQILRQLDNDMIEPEDLV